jgi:predicted oxidoreductase
MQTITLGQSSLSVSRLAFGCWRLLGANSPDEAPPERAGQPHAALVAAHETGYTLFDLADVYSSGAAETALGKTLKEVSGMRESIVIASKCGIRKKDEPAAGAPYRYDFSKEHIVASCEGSLKRLGIETIDVFMLHRPDWLCDPAEVAGAFSQLKAQGKVREFGVSNFNPSQLAMLQKACPMPLAVNQIQISLLHLAAFQDGTLDQCLAERITPMAWSPLKGGSLVEELPIDLNSPGHAVRIAVREELDRTARRHETSRKNIALAWLLKHPAKIQPVIGSAKPDNIRDAVKATEVTLSREEWYTLLEAALGQRLP